MIWINWRGSLKVYELNKLLKNKKQMEIQRRNQLAFNTPAEKAIYNAMQEVEKVGADVKLTKIVTLLSKAKDTLSDYIDKVENESRLSELCDAKNRLDKAMRYPDVNYEIGERVKVLVQNITYDNQYNRYEIQEGVIQEYRKRIAGIQDEKFIVKMETKQYPIMAFSRSEMEKLNQ